ncbi:MAG: glycerophosphodiester phosphodiesterase [Proteobacteria bacterium]|nr:glycerophosphodiester phosphodiesterase [Pseudomonadota bacterium]
MSGSSNPRPLVIGHRGCSGERPEHTMSAYLRAIEQGADAIEPDLVITRDGVLVCRHENEISGTTDVAEHPEFTDRRAERTVDGTTATGWWVEDFTLAELKTLRCKERLPALRPANTAFNGQEPILTLAEAYDLVQQHGLKLVPELKHVSYLKSIGLDPIPAFVEAVRAAGGQRAADISIVECFEKAPLVQLASMPSIRWQCVQLMAPGHGPIDQPGFSYEQMITDDGLRAVREYAVGIGVEKAMIFPRDNQNNVLPPTDLVGRAHAAGLQVIVWTFRAENLFLPPRLRRGDPSAPDHRGQHGDLKAELREFYALGVDGVFSDFPAIAVAARA